MLSAAVKVGEDADVIIQLMEIIKEKGEFFFGMIIGLIIALLFIKAFKIVITPDSVSSLNKVIASQAKLINQKNEDIALKDKRLEKCHSRLKDEQLKNETLTKKLEELLKKLQKEEK